MFKDLEQLQINGCQTDICLVGDGGVKVFIILILGYFVKLWQNIVENIEKNW